MVIYLQNYIYWRYTLKNSIIKLSCILLFLFSLFANGCSFFADGDLTQNGNSTGIQVTSLKLDKTKLSMKVGSLEYINIDYKPSNADFNPTFNYDEKIIEVTSNNNGVIIKGLEEGQTSFTVSCNNRSATCIITITGYEAGFEKTVEPYIYSNTNIIQLSPGLSEKVFVSLYGGNAADINNYTWSVEDNSVCNIVPTGQYCLIKAVSTGYTRIKVVHTKAAYPYYMGIYVFDDPSKATYITTSNNIVTINQDDGEQSISVSLINSLETSRESDFNWEVINDSNSSENPIQLSYNGNKAVITPIKSGQCTLRITHPDAVYPLDILCRVITIVQNVYIEPDTSILTLDGNKEERITSRLVNLNPGDYSLNDYNYQIENPDVAEITAAIGETVYIKGRKNGSTKLVISHTKSAYTREVLLISTNQIADAIDASCFITTTNNYVRTKVGNSPVEIKVSLKGGEDGDEKDFSWTVENYPSDDSNGNVISLETPTGNVFVSRMAQQSYAFGNAYITPVREGTATIKVTHPKVLYPLEILVKVLSKDAILEQPLFFKGEGLVRILNGESVDYTVSLNGSSKNSSDNSAISWAIDDNRIIVNGNEDTAEIKAPELGTGSTISHLTISHPKVDVSKSVLVMTADDEETLMNMKALYTDKNYYNIEIGDITSFCVQSVGFEPTENEETGEIIPYDFSLINWTVDRAGIIDFSPNLSDKREVTVTAIKAGTVKLKASLDGCECLYTITVYPIGAVQTEPEIYFTTSQNVIVFNDIGTSKQAYISAINMPGNLCSDITWTSDKENICSVVSNGTSATITALQEGEAVISVDHPQSQNTLKIYIKIGSEYIVQDSKPVYISSQDVITMLRDEQPQKIQAILVNYTGTDSEQFSFTIDNEDVANISAQTQAGIAYISPVGSGQAEVTISNPLAQINKKVLIVVGNSAEELAGIKYLTTPNNVVSIGEGKNRTISVSVKNAEDIVLDGYNWISSNYNIADVIPNGSTASIKANSVGTAIITVTNTNCKYPLEIIVHVVDPIAASAHPYIQLTSSVIVLNVDNTYTSISADLIGGTDDDKSQFIWASNDSSICMCYGQNEVGKLKAISEGTTYVTVSHPKADYSAQLLVICEKKTQSECYISVPSSIVNMKPTDDSTTITATLINGNANDKYNFNWSLDVYDIIDLQYSANVCTIKPKQAGSATITLSHPKADYDQQIIVNVQEYTTFAFPSTNITITQGEVKFLNMQVPNTSVKTHIEYFVKNEKICSVAGTKQVAQITGITNGSTTVTAKLIATNTGAEQASSDLMIYVKERAVTDAYITSASTIYTVQKGKSQTLSATITGSDIIVSDQANLKWTTSDSDVIEVTGLNTNGYVKGQSIYITAKKSGEAIITCSHDKASSALEFYVVVPGSDKKVVTLNKSYLTIIKGSSGASLTANIENAESNDDYNNLEWSVIAGNGQDGSTIARVMGSGKNVQIYPVSPGEVTVMAQLSDTDSVGKCTVIVQAGKSLTTDSTSAKVFPFKSKVINYKVSPTNAVITWIANQDDDYFEYRDLGYDTDGNGKIQIDGIKEGQGLLMGTTDGGAAVRLTVRCSWDYLFKLDTTKISGKPGDNFSIKYSVNPPDAVLKIEGMDNVFSSSIIKDDVDSGSGKLEFTSLQEGQGTIRVTAINPNAQNYEIGSYTISATSLYANLNIKPTITSVVSKSSGEKAYYSQIRDGAIYLGDGEKLTIQFDCSETGVTPTYTMTQGVGSLHYSDGGSSSTLLVSDNLDNRTITITSCDEYTEDCYQITEGYAPTYNGSRTYSDGRVISPNDFELQIGRTYYDWTAGVIGIGSGEKSVPFIQIKNTKINNSYCSISFGDIWVSNYNKNNWPMREFVVSQFILNNTDPGPLHKLPIKDPINLISEQGIWGKVRDTSLDGKCIPTNEFENCIWYYIPQYSEYQGQGTYGGITLVHTVGEINTLNIKAKYLANSLDTGVYGSPVIVGTIKIKVSHCGKDQVITYPVYVEKRKCLCTYKK